MLISLLRNARRPTESTCCLW